MTFAEILRAAEDTPDAHAYVSRVKKAVAVELEALDPTAKVTDTRYFNHSAIPDFVVTWSGEQTRREVFVRHSYEAVDAGEDERYLADADAVVMALHTGPDRSSRAAQARTSRLLVTDSVAVGVVGDHSGSGRPLSALVKANFLRGANGHINPAKAEELVQLDVPNGQTTRTTSRELISESFSEDAAARINRTADLISLAVTPEADVAPTVGGRLSLAELRSLLPWLLRQDAARANISFWQYIGSLFSFEALEEIRHDLGGVDLTPIVQANAHRWTAKRAYVGIAPSESEIRDGSWSFENAALGTNIEGRRLYVAHNGTILKKRPGNRVPNWQAVQSSLEGRRIASIELRGIRRSVTLHAAQSPDIRSDVEDVTRSLDDAYFVDRLSLRTFAAAETEGTTDLEVRFDEGLVVADTGASIADLTDTALRVLEFADPISTESVNTIIQPDSAGTEDGEIS